MPERFEETIQRTLANERGAIFKTYDGTAVRTALAFPNTYYVGMSNLGFQTIYRHLNAREDVVCERAFLPEQEDEQALRRTRTPLSTYESGTPLSQCDIVAFSISFENDYTNLIRILNLARIPLFAKDRTGYDPIVLIGGAVTYMNPEPLADFRAAVGADGSYGKAHYRVTKTLLAQAEVRILWLKFREILPRGSRKFRVGA